MFVYDVRRLLLPLLDKHNYANGMNILHQSKYQKCLNRKEASKELVKIPHIESN